MTQANKQNKKDANIWLTNQMEIHQKQMTDRSVIFN